MKENNKKLILAVIILSILVLGLGAYIIYDKVKLSKDNGKQSDNLIEIAIDSEVVLNTMEKYDYNKDTYFGVLESIFSKLYSGKMNINNFDKSELIMLALINYQKNNNIDYCNVDQNISINVDKVNNEMTKITTNVLDITIDDIKNALDESIIFLNSVNDNYLNISYCFCGGLLMDGLDTKITKAEKNDEYLYVYEKIAISRTNEVADNDNLITNYYSNLSNRDVIQSTKSTNNDFEINWNLYNTYKWTFKNVNGSYYLENIQIEN